MDDELRRAPSIKDQRSKQQEVVSDFSWQDEIYQEEHRHEIKEEYVAAKYHGFCC